MGVKIGLILEGGGSKGAFEAGVIQFIQENRIPVHVVGGTSVGGLNAACFALGKVAELVDLWANISNDKVFQPSAFAKELWAIYMGETEIHKEGFFSKVWTGLGMVPKLAEALVGIKNELSVTHFLDNSPLEATVRGIFKDAADRPIPAEPIHLYLASFNMESGQIEIFDSTKPNVKLIDAMMATSAIQAAFPPRAVQGCHYIDGGNGANLPLSQAINLGCNRIIVVRANAPEGEEKQPYDKWYSIVLRAYLASFGNATRRDIERANDMSMRIGRELGKDGRVEQIISEEVADREIRDRIIGKIREVPGAFSGKQQLNIFPVVPDPKSVPANILNFDKEASQRLIDQGRLKAADALGDLMRELNLG